VRELSKIKTAVIHCSATPDTTNRYLIGCKDPRRSIDEWHRLRGFRRDQRAIDAGYMDAGPWEHIGYHRVIHRDGTVHCGRSYFETGAHAAGRNHDTVGWCLVGNGRFTSAQWRALSDLAVDDAEQHGWDIIGHNEVAGTKKTCPNFNVSEWVEYFYRPKKENILNG